MKSVILGVSFLSCLYGNELSCLTETLYYEAGNQPRLGKIAVAFVVINRAKQDHIGICEVIKKPKQFSWYTNKRLRRKKKNKTQYLALQNLSQEILVNPDQFKDPTNGATFFMKTNKKIIYHHAKRCAKIGAHSFFKQ